MCRINLQLYFRCCVIALLASVVNAVTPNTRGPPQVRALATERSIHSRRLESAASLRDTGADSSRLFLIANNREGESLPGGSNREVVNSRGGSSGGGMQWKSTVAGFIGGMCFTLLSSAILSGATTLYSTATDIPSTFFKEQKSIDAVVVRVTDGDTFRVRHVTRLRSDPSFTGNLKDNTIVVRIAAVDTPETAKFGNAGQAYAEEAKEFVKSNLLNKRISVQLLSRDQYGRVIGLVKYKDTSGLLSSIFGGASKDISEELLKQGLAVVYRQGGAQYGGSIDKWNDIEKKAMQKKLGIWKKGASKADLPSDYKKKTKAGAKQHAYL